MLASDILQHASPDMTCQHIYPDMATLTCLHYWVPGLVGLEQGALPTISSLEGTHGLLGCRLRPLTHAEIRAALRDLHMGLGC
jgi:hypothetical protein